jgi:hypothetical protein
MYWKTPLPVPWVGGGGVSADVIWGKNMKRKRKKENFKKKRRKYKRPRGN